MEGTPCSAAAQVSQASRTGGGSCQHLHVPPFGRQPSGSPSPHSLLVTPSFTTYTAHLLHSVPSHQKKRGAAPKKLSRVASLCSPGRWHGGEASRQPAHSPASSPDRAAQPCAAFPALLPAGGETGADRGAGAVPGGHAAGGESGQEPPLPARSVPAQAVLGAEPAARRWLARGRVWDASSVLLVTPSSCLASCPAPRSLPADSRWCL